MKLSTQEKLTAAFEKGRKNGWSGRDGIPGQLVLRSEKEKKFYWAGYEKGKTDARAYYNSDEYKAEQKAHEEQVMNMLGKLADHLVTVEAQKITDERRKTEALENYFEMKANR